MDKNVIKVVVFLRGFNVNKSVMKLSKIFQNRNFTHNVQIVLHLKQHY